MITAFFRTAILYLLLIVGLRLTGKRQIGELEPIELVLTHAFVDLASVPMQDFGHPPGERGHPHCDAARRMSMLLSCVSLRSMRFQHAHLRQAGAGHHLGREACSRMPCATTA